MLSTTDLEISNNTNHGFHIPPKPQILSSVENILKSEEPDMGALAELIATDIGLSSVVLQAVNSALYSTVKDICDIRRAVMILGLNVVRALVIGAVLRRAYNQKSCISLERFWDSTTDVANAMVFIGSKITQTATPDKLYTVGLFHHCAIPAFAAFFQDYREVLAQMDRVTYSSETDIEDKKYGTNHATIGHSIAHSWSLPEDICTIILNHHDSEFLQLSSSDEGKNIFAILKLAENMVERIRRAKNVADWGCVKNEIYDYLELDQQMFDSLTEALGGLLVTD